MKKKILSYVILSMSIVGICSTSQAAPIFQIGPRVGIGGSHLMLDLDANKKSDYKTDMGFTWHLGVVSRLDFTYVYIQPELLFTSSGATYHSANKGYALHYRNISIPVMVGVILGEGIRIRPQAGLVLKALLHAMEGDDDITVNYDRLTVGWQAGAGIDFGPLMIDLVYEGNLSKLGKKLKQINVDVDHRMGSFKLSAGLDLISLIRANTDN